MICIYIRRASTMSFPPTAQHRLAYLLILYYISTFFDATPVFIYPTATCHRLAHSHLFITPCTPTNAPLPSSGLFSSRSPASKSRFSTSRFAMEPTKTTARLWVFQQASCLASRYSPLGTVPGCSCARGLKEGLFEASAGRSVLKFLTLHHICNVTQADS